MYEDGGEYKGFSRPPFSLDRIQAAKKNTRRVKVRRIK